MVDFPLGASDEPLHLRPSIADPQGVAKLPLQSTNLHGGAYVLTDVTNKLIVLLCEKRTFVHFRYTNVFCLFYQHNII